jgi:hypothetical protein
MIVKRKNANSSGTHYKINHDMQVLLDLEIEEPKIEIMNNTATLKVARRN